MSEEKKCNCHKIGFVLLVINTLLLLCVCAKLYCPVFGGSGFCAMHKGKQSKICPIPKQDLEKMSGLMEKMVPANHP